MTMAGHKLSQLHTFILEKQVDFQNMYIFGNFPINKDAFVFSWRQGKVDKQETTENSSHHPGCTRVRGRRGRQEKVRFLVPGYSFEHHHSMDRGWRKEREVLWSHFEESLLRK